MEHIIAIIYCCICQYLSHASSYTIVSVNICCMSHHIILHLSISVRLHSLHAGPWSADHIIIVMYCCTVFHWMKACGKVCCGQLKHSVVFGDAGVIYHFLLCHFLVLRAVHSSAQFVIAKQDRAGQGRTGRAGQKLAKCRTAQCCMVEHGKKHYDTDKREAEGGATVCCPPFSRVDNKQGEECRERG